MKLCKEQNWIKDFLSLFNDDYNNLQEYGQMVPSLISLVYFFCTVAKYISYQGRVSTQQAKCGS